MRVAVSHNKPKEEVVRNIDRTFADLLAGGPGIPIKVVDQKKEWTGSTMNFSMTAKMGLLKTPIAGTVEVTEREVIIDADLGMLERFLPSAQAQQVVGDRIRGLLK